MVEFLSQLTCRILDEGYQLFQNEEKVDRLTMIQIGSIHLYGYHRFPGVDQETLRFKVVTLTSGSWFGDYQILLKIPCFWEVEVGRSAKDEQVRGLATYQSQLLEINADSFRKLADKYPQFRSVVVTRANYRRTYWQKIYEENRQEVLL